MAPPGSPATTCSSEPDAVRRSMGLTGQTATVDELLTGRENLALISALYGLDARTARRVGDDLLERFSLTDAGRPRREDLLRGHAPTARPRRQPGRHPAGALPRRADHRSRPAQPGRAVGRAARAGPRRHDAGAHDPVPRGGRPARRPHRRHRQGPHHRPGHPAPAQGRVRRGGAWWSRSPTPTTCRGPRSCSRRWSPRSTSTRAPASSSAPASGLGDMTRIAARLRRQRHRARRPRASSGPSLDDVFLNLTGHRAEEPAEHEEEEVAPMTTTTTRLERPEIRRHRPAHASRWRSPGAT